MPNNVGSSLGGSSLVLHSQQTSFDVRIEADVISLLKIVHQNPLDAEVKNHLRDLIFAYKQEETEAGQKAIADAFAQLGVSVVASSNQAEQATAGTPSEKKSTFGMGRPQPVFKAVTVHPQVKPTATEGAVPTFVAQAPAQTQKFVDRTVAQVVPPPAPTIPVAESVGVKPEPTVIPTPAAESAPAPFVNPNQRINEIKSIVNQKVGNPVNLIEAHNLIGREYMNALLDAMKKANGGQQGDVATSMERLEKAFVAVTSALTSDKVERVTPVSIAPTQVPPTPIPSAETAAAKKEIAPEVKIPVAPAELVREREPQQQARTIEVKSNVQHATTQTPQASPQRVVTSMAPVSSFTKSPVNNQSQQQTRTQVPHANQQASQRREVLQATPAAQTAIHSVAQDKEEQNRKHESQIRAMAQSAEAEKKRIAELDPLLTPAVTAGLGQLLSEWGLFKSSGIFGTGPSGKDHPLYQKLAPLTMAAVIAGRFEGVTPQIKQSITDYMNGWRYEEEIIHEHQETFEHYLRRVIFHILNKNKVGSAQ